jgi:hypothetical protein
MNSRQIFKWAVFIAGVLLIYSLTLERILDPDPSAGWVIMPGFIVGVFVAEIIAIGTKGNAHFVNLVTILVVAGVINFFCYLGVTYLVLLRWSRTHKD